MNPSLPSPSPPLTAAPGALSRRDEDRYLWEAFRFHSRTFSLATLLLPGGVRLPIATLYLYCRSVDTIADERVLEVGADRAQAELDGTRCDLERALAGRPSDDLLWRRLAEVHERYDLPSGPLHELLDGAAWDLSGRPIDDVKDLLAYSDLVAGSVGAMMLPFLAEDRAQADALTPSARALGRAMQITNVLRDVGEDRRALGRVYLPRDTMDAFGIAPSDLDGTTLATDVPDAYAALLESLMAEAETLYAEGARGTSALPFRSRVGIAAAGRMYREIMNEVRAAGYDNLRQRSYVPLRRKLRLVVHDGYDGRKRRLASPIAHLVR